MKLAIKSKTRIEARRQSVPVRQFCLGSFPIEIIHLLPRCAGPAALQVTSSQRTGTTLTKQQALSQQTGI